MGDENNASIGVGKYIQGMKELNFYFPQCNMPKMGGENQELALSASYLEIYQMNQLKVAALG